MERPKCCICNIDLSDRDDLENKMCYSCVVGDPMELDNHIINLGGIDIMLRKDVNECT